MASRCAGPLRSFASVLFSMGWFQKTAPTKEEAPKKKLCCACPETKVHVMLACGHRCIIMLGKRLQPLYSHARRAAMQAPRDECIATHGTSELAPCHTCPVRSITSPPALSHRAFVNAGPEDPRCVALIEAHKACLRSEGFKVRTPHS